MDVQTAVNQLVQALKTTKEYQAVTAAYAALKQKPEAARKLEEFDEKSRRAYENGSSQAIDKLAADYERLRHYPEISAFFSASEQLGHLLNTVFGTVSGALER